MVAEAKDEREQLNRLLTVSVPRESVAVVGVALVVIVLGLWLFYGSVARSLTLDGVVLGTEGVSPDGKRSVQALVSVAREVAGQVVTGAPVAMRLGAQEPPVTVAGTVAGIAIAHPPDSSAEFAARVPVALYRVDVAVGPVGVDPASLAGSPCRIVVDAGEQAPFALFWKASRTVAL